MAKYKKGFTLGDALKSGGRLTNEIGKTYKDGFRHAKKMTRK